MRKLFPTGAAQLATSVMAPGAVQLVPAVVKETLVVLPERPAAAVEVAAILGTYRKQ